MYVPPINLASIAELRTPRMSPGPGGSLRPRLGRLRMSDGLMDDTPHDLNWDQAKHDAAEGKNDDGLGPLRPERAP